MLIQTKKQKQGRHEGSPVSLKVLGWCLAGFILAVLLLQLGVFYYRLYLGEVNKGFGGLYQIEGSRVTRYPFPALQINPPKDLQAYQTQARQDLNSYGWVDQAKGIAKIPIERAMAIVATKGLPVRPPVQDGPSELDMQRQKAGAPAPMPTSPP